MPVAWISGDFLVQASTVHNFALSETCGFRRVYRSCRLCARVIVSCCRILEFAVFGENLEAGLCPEVGLPN